MREQQRLPRDRKAKRLSSMAVGAKSNIHFFRAVPARLQCGHGEGEHCQQWICRTKGGTKDGRLDNTRATLRTAVFRLDFISLTITATHPRCGLAAISVVIDELEKIRRDRYRKYTHVFHYNTTGSEQTSRPKHVFQQKSPGPTDTSSPNFILIRVSTFTPTSRSRRHLRQ